jgi:two-component system, chemotaxis family, chemotaxis protein CheY
MPRILVTDDEPGLRVIIRRFLEPLGFEVQEAEDGAVAERKVKSQLPDLVILDVLMPHQEGITTVRNLKSAYPNLKIVAMSGGGNKGMFDFLDIAKQFGADEILRKPFSKQELLDAVRRCLATVTPNQ